MKVKGIKNMNIIELNNVKKSFKNQVLFENVSLSICQGTIVGFAGDNGCGKSVLFKLISGIYKPDVGDIIIRKNNISKSYDLPEDIGILIDEPGYVEIYTGFTNLKYLASIRNKIDDNQIIQTMKNLGLSPENKEKVKNYSLGMKKKLGIAQAIMEDQSIIILDEPFNALDSSSQENVKKIIRKLKEDDKIVLITSHQAIDLDELCDQVYEIKNQKISLKS